jgi:hypothetical protein
MIIQISQIHINHSSPCFPPFFACSHQLPHFPSKTMEGKTQYYEHGRFKVVGGVLPNAITAYRTYGSPSNPCIVFPTCYGAKMELGSEPAQ